MTREERRAALVEEITTDPAGVGFAALVAAGAWPALVAALNAPREAPAVVDSILLSDVSDVFDAGEVMAAPFEALQRLAVVLLAVQAGGRNSVRPGRSVSQFVLGHVFPEATAPITHNALRALAVRACSRAEAALGLGSVVSLRDVLGAVAPRRWAASVVARERVGPRLILSVSFAREASYAFDREIDAPADPAEVAAVLDDLCLEQEALDVVAGEV